MNFDHMRIVLVNTSHPGNIGSTARAMKNMGFKHLYLVNPAQFPHQKANELASRADDILEQAIVTDSLAEAIKGCHLVMGTSARIREFEQQPLIDTRIAAKKIVTEYADKEVALVFGRERTGLFNEELNQCQYHIHIPAMDEYNSLNLAAAVLVVVYELRMTLLETEGIAVKREARQLPTARELDGLFKHIEEALIAIKFLKPNNPRHLMARLKRMMTRADIDRDDLDLLRGIMTAILRAQNDRKV